MKVTILPVLVGLGPFFQIPVRPTGPMRHMEHLGKNMVEGFPSFMTILATSVPHKQREFF